MQNQTVTNLAFYMLMQNHAVTNLAPMLHLHAPKLPMCNQTVPNLPSSQSDSPQPPKFPIHNQTVPGLAVINLPYYILMHNPAQPPT